MKIFVILIVFFSVSCQAQQDTKGIDNINNILKSLPSSAVVTDDTLTHFKHPVGLFQEGNDYSTDTTIRVGPYYFANIPSLLIIHLKNGTAIQIDLVFTQYTSILRPMLRFTTKSVLELYPNLDSPYWNFVNRQYSNVKEFQLLLDSLKTKFGEPTDSTGDTLLFWNDKKISIRSRNKFSTTIISFYKENTNYNARHDWEFTAIIPDTTILSLSSGVTKESLKKRIGIVDTVVQFQSNNNVTYGVSHIKLWGIPGDVLFTFDKDNNLSEFGWQAQSTGSNTMVYPFRLLIPLIDEIVSDSYPERNSKDDGETIQYYWSNEKETVYAYYLYVNQRIQIGRVPKVAKQHIPKKG